MDKKLMKVPFMDLYASNSEVEEEVLEAVRNIIKNSQFVNGRPVQEFEKSLAEYVGTKYAIGVSSGTEALRLSLIASGFKEGDIVLMAPNTFFAAFEVVQQLNGIVRLIDVDPKTHNISFKTLKHYIDNCRTITGKPIDRKYFTHVSYLMPVHLYGQPVDMTDIYELATDYGIKIIEDACQALGSELLFKDKWVKAGSVGITGAFSFYPGKNLGAMGEGGAVTTNDKEIYKNIGYLRDHGQTEKYVHSYSGFNSRLHAMQAKILNIKLKHLDKWIEQKRALAQTYDSLLVGIPEVEIPATSISVKHSYHLYVIKCKERARLKEFLDKNEISTMMHYPIPIHAQAPYAHTYDNDYGKLPVAEKLATEILSLPMYPGLTEEQQEFVVSKIKEFYFEHFVRS